MKRQNIAIVSVLMLILMTSCRRPTEEDLPQTSNKPNDCGLAVLAAKGKAKGYSVSSLTVERLVLEKDQIAPDGQKVGHESHTYEITLTCKVTEVSAEITTGEDTLKSDYRYGMTTFSRRNKKVYVDTVYGSNAWLRQYTNIEDVDAQIPNWNTKSGKDLPVTFIASDETTAHYVPVWAYAGLWTKDGENYYLVGGKVFLKNPSMNHPTKDDVFTAMRFDDNKVVATRGVLFPVSEESWTSYLLYAGGRAKTWERSAEADQSVLTLVGTDKFSHTRAKKHRIASILARRGVYSSNLPTVKSSFEPTTVPKLNLDGQKN